MRFIFLFHKMTTAYALTHNKSGAIFCQHEDLIFKSKNDLYGYMFFKNLRVFTTIMYQTMNVMFPLKQKNKLFHSHFIDLWIPEKRTAIELVGQNYNYHPTIEEIQKCQFIAENVQIQVFLLWGYPFGKWRDKQLTTSEPHYCYMWWNDSGILMNETFDFLHFQQNHREEVEYIHTLKLFGENVDERIENAFLLTNSMKFEYK